MGKPDSSHSLIMPMKSMDLVAMNSARKADITEFNSKALQDTYAPTSAELPFKKVAFILGCILLEKMTDSPLMVALGTKKDCSKKATSRD